VEATHITMATREQRITKTDQVLTTETDGWFTFSPLLTVRRQDSKPENHLCHSDCD
jgi:hypothetical protein